MSKRCDLTGVGPVSGHLVSHSNRKTKRRFVPNLQNISFLSNILGQSISLKVTPAALRTVDHNGGLDSFLLNTSNLKLTETAKKIKRKLKKALEAKTAEKAEKPAKAAPKKKAKAKRPAKKTVAEKAAKKVTIKKVVKAKKPASAKAAAKKAPAKKAAKKAPAKKAAATKAKAKKK